MMCLMTSALSFFWPAVPFHMGSCCVESTTVSMRVGFRPTYSTVTWLLASGRRPLTMFFSRTIAWRFTSSCEIAIGSGMSSGVSLHAKPNIMPWSPAPSRSTPMAMSWLCLPSTTLTPQLFQSKPLAASS